MPEIIGVVDHPGRPLELVTHPHNVVGVCQQLRDVLRAEDTSVYTEALHPCLYKCLSLFSCGPGLSQPTAPAGY